MKNNRKWTGVSLSVALFALASGAGAQGLLSFDPGASGDVSDPYVLSGEILSAEGEALVWSESETQVLIAIDENDRSGRRDGKIDQVFSFRSSQPLPEAISFRDPAARIQVHRAELAVVLRSEGLILRFFLEGARNASVLAEEEQFPARTFRHGLALQKYSDSPAQQVALEAIARQGAAGLSKSAENSLFDPYMPAPTIDGSGGTCMTSCSVNQNSCPGGGSCSTTCSQGYCASCECLQGGGPSCSCKR